MDRPDSGAGSRPADVARRALRAARERDRYGAGADAVDQRGSGSAPGADAAGEKRTPDARTAPQASARPADVAREALRRAAESRAGGLKESAESAGERGGVEPVGGRGEAEPLTRSAPGGRAVERASADPGDSRLGDGPGPGSGAWAGGGSKPGARPGDIAREALRAARDATGRARGEAEGTRAEAEAEAEATDKAGRTSRPPAAGRDRASGSRMGDVRELLADAFKLPSEEPEADETSLMGTDTEGEGVGSAAAGEFHEPPPPREGVTRDRATHGPAVPGRTTHAPSPATGGTSARREPTSAVADPEPAPARPSAPHQDTDLAAAPRVPRTMAAPSRDGELRRTFRPLPPRPSAGEAFAESWWGNTWVTALEEGALDAARLARGRAYADKGQVDAITVTPGLVLAYVHGSRPRPYRVQLRLRTLDEKEWDRFLDAAAEQPGHIAALLDKELPQTLAGPEAGSEAGSEAGPGPEAGFGAAAAADRGPGRLAGPGAGDGVRLLPGAGELEPRCSCPDFGHPCKHAAALCYQTARLLDEDPFVLLLLRGRGERELLDALSRRNAARAARAAQEQEPAPLPGVRALDALAPRTLPPLPAPSPPPPHPEQPPVYPGVPGGPDPFALDQLATDAAARAHALLTTGRDPVAELTLWQDAVRLAAARPGSGLTATTRALYSSLAAATGRTPADLARAVAAWRQGGLEGLAVLEDFWDPPAGRFDRARPLLLAADLPAFRPRRNHLTHPRGHVQLRLGRDGLWYAYESEPGHDDWWPRGTPDLDPVGALTGLGSADD
ncbi:SWIM zinc finger family protein [Streptomyces sp. NBC_01314]|uniref:SWIM zinc finger family protein n=1 Tax=Streptomyces sp. NBC_01314 TaxID=2903821 RepID=UPI00308846A4|nr:SWIM zinc finger family protein [Streptomyces sp. NBC_01314]